MLYIFSEVLNWVDKAILVIKGHLDIAIVYKIDVSILLQAWVSIYCYVTIEIRLLIKNINDNGTLIWQKVQYHPGSVIQ